MKFYGDVRLKQLVRHADAGHSKSARKALDVLRVGLWFEELRTQLGCATAYGLGQVVQPHTYKKGFHHNNLWAKYAAGRHLPGSETVRACAKKLPGSEELLASPAWRALDVTRPLEGCGDALLRSLRPSIQSAVFDEQELAKGRYIRRGALGTSLRSLEGQADLQSLAAIVVLLRDAHANGDRSKAFTTGRSLHRTLLMATVGSPLKFISLELFEFFIRDIFPMTAGKEFAMDLDRNMLNAQAGWLRRTAMQLHAAGRRGFSLVGNTRQLRRLLQLDFGFDLLYGLGPRLKLIVPAEAACPSVCSFVATNNARCDWGASVLGAGQCVRFVPDHVP
ncbi:hypothetical protein LDO31_08670 [Luteimonas sp. XNQY3]|nr:hypothetical protein [Luteimonas sp. XNQY3]MCD9006306.1 hypothetical protein [Luteimonas sp. XNQY3]